MSKAKWVRDTLTLCDTEVPVRVGVFKQADLLFYPDNPRVYSIVRADENEPSQRQIETRLGAMDHVKQLVQSIRANGGLTDPLIVRDRDFVVLEGNSRLAAYRILARNDPIRWGQVKVKLLPGDIGEDMVFALLGEYHIIGKKDWAPYEQAGYLYRRHVKHGTLASKMASEMGLSTQKINHLIRVYEFMIKHGDNNVSRWSFYDEYLRHTPVKKARLVNPGLDEVVVKKIKSGEIPRAVDVREGLTKVVKAGGRVLDQFMSGEADFERSYQRAVNRGVNNTWYNRFHKFRSQVADSETRDDILDMPAAHRKKCVFELKKILQATKALLAKVQ